MRHLYEVHCTLSHRVTFKIQTVKSLKIASFTTANKLLAYLAGKIEERTIGLLINHLEGELASWLGTSRHISSHLWCTVRLNRQDALPSIHTCYTQVLATPNSPEKTGCSSGPAMCRIPLIAPPTGSGGGLIPNVFLTSFSSTSGTVADSLYWPVIGSRSKSPELHHITINDMRNKWSMFLGSHDELDVLLSVRLDRSYKMPCSVRLNMAWFCNLTEKDFCLVFTRHQWHR